MNSLISQGKIQEMIVVMPNGDNSAYENGCTGSLIWSCGKYEDYIVRDLITEIDGKYYTIPDGAHRAIGGISLGARGAMRIAFLYTGKFSAVVGHSGRYDYLVGEMTDQDWERVKNSGLMIYFDRGDNDYLITYSQTSDVFDEILTSKGINHEYVIVDMPTSNPAEAHDWPFWSQRSVVALEKDCQKICYA